MIDQIMYIAGFEFVQDGNGYGAVGDGGQEAHAPVSLVAGANSHLIPFLKAALLEGDVQLGNPPGHIPVGQRHALIIGEGRPVPVLDEAFLKDFVNGFEFHMIRFGLVQFEVTGAAVVAFGRDPFGGGGDHGIWLDHLAALVLEVQGVAAFEGIQERTDGSAHRPIAFSLLRFHEFRQVLDGFRCPDALPAFRFLAVQVVALQAAVFV